MNAIIQCDEEEYAPFFAALWKLPRGWRWIVLPLRGPGEILALPMTLIGIWRFARKPQRLSDLSDSAFAGAKVTRICPYLGSYGMGGPGFWGLRCRLNARSFWIVYRLWSADGWVTIDNHLVESSLIGDEKKHIPLERRIDSACLIGARIVSYEIARDSSTLMLEDREGGVRQIVLRMDGSVVPPWRGNGKKKQFSDGESLEDAVIVTKGGRLWTTD